MRGRSIADALEGSQAKHVPETASSISACL